MGAKHYDTAGKTETAGASPQPGAERATLFRCRPGSAPGHLFGRLCKCRKRFNAGVPGAVAPGETN